MPATWSQPEFPIDAHAGLIKMDHRRINYLPLDLLFHRLKDFVGALVRINQGSLTQLVTKEVSEQFTGAFSGQKLVLAQIDGDGFEAGSILHRLPDLFRERSLDKAATMRAKLFLGLVLGYFHLDRRQIKHLASFITGGLCFFQRTTTSSTSGYPMDDRMVRVVCHL